MVSRIVGGKGIEEAIAGARAAGVKLKITGEIITPLNHYTIESHDKIEFLGRVSDDKLPGLYGGAKGFVALSRDEDFGMTVVESMMHGTPVLAYRGGGYLETVVEGKTGIFVSGVSTKEIGEGVEQMEKIKWDREEIKKSVSKFGRVWFEKGVRRVVGA
jgi:glycosyltransferase involved in cell wall biosynthesis